MGGLPECLLLLLMKMQLLCERIGHQQLNDGGLDTMEVQNQVVRLIMRGQVLDVRNVC